MTMQTRIRLAFAGIVIFSVCTLFAGCQRSKFYIHEVQGGAANGGYTYFKERTPTTQHGICAAVYGGGSTWEIDLPAPGTDPTKPSPSDDTVFAPSAKEALKIAEQHCPTGTDPGATRYD